MVDFAHQLKANKNESTLLVLYIPSADRQGDAIGKNEQARWVRVAMKVLGKNLGGATAFPRGLGVWRDDAQGGKLVWDKPVVIQCYTNEADLEHRMPALREFLESMGTRTKQGAVGLVIDHDYYEIQFPLKGD